MSSSPTSSRSRPALAAEIEGVPCATLIPHVFPEGAPRPADLLARRAAAADGASVARSGAGRGRPLEHGLQLGRAQLNDTRARLGLPALDYTHGGTSRELALVATFPQLEYPRSWPSHAHVVGPLMWEPPAADVELPPGDAPLVLVAPSTAQDPVAPDAPCRAARPRRRARAGARDVEPPPPRSLAARPRERPASSTGSPTRARCRSAMSSSATPGTARSCARSPRGAPWSPARRSAT